MSFAFSIKAACNVLLEQGGTFEQIESFIKLLKETNKINDGYILQKDLKLFNSKN